MPNPSTPSLAELSFRYRRRHVLRAIRDPGLTPAAKQVLVHLSLRDDDPFVLAERPPVAELARRLGLAERSVRQAIADLVTAGHLTFRQTGEAYRAGEARRPGESLPADAEAHPDLAREATFLAEAKAPISFAEHVDMLGHLRDRAVAAGRLATAVSAERAIGRALGLARPPSPPQRPRTPEDDLPGPEKKRRYLARVAPVMVRTYARDPHYGPALRRFCDTAQTLILEDRAREAERVAAAGLQ